MLTPFLGALHSDACNWSRSVSVQRLFEGWVALRSSTEEGAQESTSWWCCRQLHMYKTPEGMQPPQANKPVVLLPLRVHVTSSTCVRCLPRRCDLREPTSWWCCYQLHMRSIYLIKCVTRIRICRMDRFTAVNPPVPYRWHLEITLYGTVRRRLYAVRHQ
jgi:hypothetical protein